MRRLWRAGRGLRCAAVTPVGPGHAEFARECRASMEAAWRLDHGPFSRLDYCFVDDGQGALGRSKARNVGVSNALAAGADWVFFLDADDLMAPRAFALFADYAERFDAVWGLIAMRPPATSDHHIRFPQALTLESADELMLLDPFITLLMGHFVRAGAAAASPFDEAMDAGEDFDYYIRVWEKYRCIKISQVLSINRQLHAVGPRAASADQWRAAAVARLAAARERRGLHPQSARAIAAFNRCSAEAQAVNRAQELAAPASYPVLVKRLPYYGPINVSPEAGSEFVLDAKNDDPAALHIAWFGEYQPASARLWQALAKAASVVLDIGAGTGYYALLAARAARAATIICFERVESTFQRLELNLRLNAASNVRAMHAAAAQDDDQGEFTTAAGGGGAHTDGTAAPTISIDAYLRGANCQNPGLIRLAAPQSAVATIRGMAHTLATATPDLLIELSDEVIAASIERELRTYGYRFYAIDENTSSLVAANHLTDGGRTDDRRCWATARSPAAAAATAGEGYCTLTESAATP